MLFNNSVTLRAVILAVTKTLAPLRVSCSSRQAAAWFTVVCINAVSGTGVV